MIYFENYHKSKVVVGESFRNLLNYIPAEKRSSLVIITDTNIDNLYRKDFPSCPVIQIESGESVKTQETVNDIIRRLIDIGSDRHSFLVGIGGGVVCDITGYAASIFMRGIPFGYVSTSLLSQIDASIGGKTGVNFMGFKNLIGTFNQPEFVLCDLEMLKTLPEAEIQNGLAEAIKHAIIADAAYFRFISTHANQLNSLDMETIEKLVSRSIEIKTAIVGRDEKEKGERKKLNFGHTFGHAIESLSGISHGRAVSVGMMKAVELSAGLDFCDPALVEALKSLLQKFDLPVKSDLPNELLEDAILKDKKRNTANVDFVFLKEIGNVEVKPIPIESLF